jgi:hypothetical protein
MNTPNSRLRLRKESFNFIEPFNFKALFEFKALPKTD